MTPSVLDQPGIEESGNESQSAPPTADWGINNRDAPDSIKNAILAAVRDAQGQEEFLRKSEILQDAELRFYDMEVQHIYRNNQDGWSIASPGGSYVFQGAEEFFGEYIKDYNIFSAFALIQQAKLSENMPGIDFQPVDPNQSDDIEAANAAEGMRHDFDRNNDIKELQKEIIYHFQMGGRAVIWTRTDDSPEKFGISKDGKPRRTGTASVYGCIEAKVPIFAKKRRDFWYCLLYDDPDIKSAKTDYPWIADKITAGRGCLAENSYERLARLQILQGSQGNRQAFQIGDSIAHLIGRGQCFLRLSAFQSMNEAYVDPDGAEESIEDENGPRPIQVKEKIAQVFPDGVHACIIGDEYAEAVNKSMDDAISIGHAFIGKGQNRRPIMKSMVVVQDRFNSSMNYVAETNDFCVPSTWVSCDPQEYAAIKKQKAQPGAFRNLKQLPAGVTSVANAVYSEEGHDIPESFQKYIEMLYTSLPQFQLSLPPSAWGQAMQDQKLMDVNEAIPTPDGFVRNGDLQTGGSVFGEDGKIYEIIKAHPPQTIEAFRVTFDDGTFTHVHGGHLWYTQTRNERIRQSRQRRKIGKVRTTQEIAETLLVGTEENKMGVCVNHTVPIANAIDDLPAADLPIDPYCLGAWLGDGNANGGSHYTATDKDGPDILKFFEAAGYPYRRLEKSPNDWSISGLTAGLQKLGVRGNKHIPSEYLWASKGQRLALLQGLMDTDGNCSINGRARFCNSNKNLSDGVYHLAASLGMKVFRSTGKIDLNGVKCADAHYVEWAGDLPCFRLNRKLKGMKQKYSAQQKLRYITSVVAVGPMKMRCLTTDNPTGLYLFGRNFNVTHNTASGYQLAAAQAMGIQGTFWTSMTHMMASMYYHNCLSIMNDSEYPEQITIPGEGGKNTIVRKASLTKGNFRAFPDTDSGFPETTAAKRATLERVVTMLGATPIAAQIMGSPDNVAFMVREEGLTELVIPEAEARNKQEREIETLLDGSPRLAPEIVQLMQGSPGDPMAGIPPSSGADVPTLMAAIKAMIAQGEANVQQQMITNAAMGIAAQATGGAAPPPPAPFDPASVARSSVPVWESDYHVWEAKKCRDWLSSDERNTEETIGRPSANPEDMGANKPNVAGILNVVLHWQEHLAMAALEAPPVSGPLPAQNMPPPPPGGVTPAVAAPGAPTAAVM